MKRWNIAAALASLAGVAYLLLAAATSRHEAVLLAARVAGMNDSLASLTRSVDSMRTARPGIGDYMSTVQLHAAKLWYAGNAVNWKLAQYELDELGEAIEGAKGLHALKNGVDISAVLESVGHTQLATLDSSIAAKNLLAFGSAYRQALEACNGCHRAAGYAFIQIVLPSREPVTNQRWTVE